MKKALSGVCVTSAKDVVTRQRYVRLVDGVREGAGTVRIFSSLHVSGERESFLIISYVVCDLQHHSLCRC